VRAHESGWMHRVAAALVFWALAGACQAAEPLKVRIGILSGAAQAGLVVAAKMGYFARHGFDADVKLLTGGVQANQALASNQVDWSAGGLESVIVATGVGLPFKAYAMYAKGGDSYGVLARRESNIRDLHDLRGKRVAIVAGTAPDYGFQAYLQSGGLRIDAVNVVNATYVSMGQMLIAGSVDAIVAIEPYLSLTLQKLGDQGILLTRLGRYVQGGGLFLISNAWAQAHPDRIDDAVLALWEAEQFVRQHPDEAAKVQAEFIKAPVESVETAFRYLTFDPRIDAFTTQSVEKMSDFLQEAGKITRKLDAQAVIGSALDVQARLAKTHPEALR
jgi:ABC-type nitrate/sulfonate/bicarbonate transport system substrate-binding protein